MIEKCTSKLKISNNSISKRNKESLSLSLTLCFPNVTFSFQLPLFPIQCQQKSDTQNVSVTILCSHFHSSPSSFSFRQNVASSISSFPCILRPFPYPIHGTTLIELHWLSFFFSVLFSLLFCHTSGCCTKSQNLIHLLASLLSPTNLYEIDLCSCFDPVLLFSSCQSQ